MSFNALNATVFESKSNFYFAEFEDILYKIILCYNFMTTDKVSLINDENSIRNIILSNYLKVERFKVLFGLTNYLFDKEIEEDTGRIDIRIMPINPFLNDDAYYIIECKRIDNTNIDGTTGLNAKYIENGICRFITEKYPSYYQTNGMIGFVVEPIDIHKNTQSINKLLRQEFLNACTKQELTYKEIHPQFKHSYYSRHTIFNKTIILYHLMLDFSGNIKIKE